MSRHYPIIFLFLTIISAFLTQPSHSFSPHILTPKTKPTTTSTNHQSLYLSKPNPKKKRRRFAQDVHHDTIQQQQQQQQLQLQTKKEDASYEQQQQQLNTKQEYPKQQQQDSSLPNNTHHQRKQRRPPSKSVMRSNMSIEELESVMMRRWGTDIKKWRADPNEYELDSGSSSGVKKEKSRTFRGRKVLNPWEKEDLTTLETKQRASSIEKKSSSKQQQSQKKEFYDEDDEGYEDEGGYGDLIRPDPVGGSGGGGLFFRTKQQQEETTDVGSAKRQDEEPSKTTTTTTTSKRQKKKATPARLDDDGNEMYLTLDLISKLSQSDSSDTIASDSPSSSSSSSGIPSFAEMNLHPTLQTNLQSLQITHPLPVQHDSFDPISNGKNVILSTSTGSGKTIAFLLPLLQRMMMLSASSAASDGTKNKLRCIIVAPGRELASQICDVAKSMIRDTDLKVVMTIGGTPFQRNVEQLRKMKPDIVVGTPGRLAELMMGRVGEKSGKLKIPSSSSGPSFTLVLDEFDALYYHQPHSEPTKAIIDQCQTKHSSLQTILCSATAHTVETPSFLQHPILIRTSSHNTTNNNNTVMSTTTLHGAIHLPHKKLAIETLRKFLHTTPTPQQVLVFVNTPRRVDIIVQKLLEQNILAAPLRGGSSSDKIDRAEVCRALRDGTVGLVVSTEMAARGIDAPHLTHVVNLDLPTDANHYAHRAGRVGRGRGRGGIVVSVTDGKKERNVPRRLAESLGVDVWEVEVRGGKLVIVE